MGDATRPFRPIAPRTLTPGGGVEIGQLPPNGGSSNEEGQKKRASTACKECQKRRTRAHDRECVFDELSDRRRKASARRTQEELTRSQQELAGLRDFLDQLLGALGSNDSDVVRHLIDTIRSGASHEEIRRAVLLIHTQSSATHPHGMDPNMINNHMNNFFDSH
ncbi:hypothetical protein N7520_010315 [Penicillium odoratum]|uniref:uncharacterized protein n=1 Tax=Penicillium odoratum TaxID=1167516 RepID=UPI0025481DCE|nr:uncharacterized protein N7520_010315 [Penicillium odoratum]KAJ5745133.1 hypothetical protein N7520_010315 [Penicillium odoratum]